MNNFSKNPNPHALTKSSVISGSFFATLLLGSFSMPAHAVQITIGSVSLETSRPQYFTNVHATHFPIYSESASDNGSSAFIDGDSIAPAPAAESLINPTSSQMSPFPDPFNGGTTALASALATNNSELEVGVSGRAIREGSLSAVAEYTFDLTALDDDATNINLLYSIPETEITLIGNKDQVGPNFGAGPDVLLPDGRLQYSYALAYASFFLIDPDGEMIPGSEQLLYFHKAQLNKVSATRDNPLGFAFNASDDTERVLLVGVPQTSSATEDVFGSLDLARWTIDPFDALAVLPDVPRDFTARLTFSSQAFTATTPFGVELAGGEARIGDPFTLTATMPQFSFFHGDAPPSGPVPVPLPASLVLLGSALAMLGFGGRLRGSLRHCQRKAGRAAKPSQTNLTPKVDATATEQRHG